jgi:hypothetical protein
MVLATGAQAVDLGDAGVVHLQPLDELVARQSALEKQLEIKNQEVSSGSTGARQAFVEAGAVLAPNLDLWDSTAAKGLLESVQQVHREIDQIDEQERDLALQKRSGLSGLFRKVGDASTKHRLDKERSHLQAGMADRLAELGAAAPSTTFPEADAPLQRARTQRSAADAAKAAVQQLTMDATDIKSEIQRRQAAQREMGFDALYSAAYLTRHGAQPIASPIVLKAGEAAYQASPCVLARWGTRTRYVGGSQGFSFPIGHTGIRYRVGSFSGHPIQTTLIKDVDTGQLVLTSSRLVFAGQMKTVSLTYAKLINIKLYTDALAVFHEGKENPDFFRLSAPKWVLFNLNWLMGRAQR